VSDTSSRSGGIGVLGLLGVVFVTLKLIGVIDWDWWWVTIPFWGGLVIFAAILALIGAGLLAVHIFESISKKSGDA